MGDCRGESGGNTELQFHLADGEDWQTARKLWGTVSNGKFSNATLHEGDRVLIAIGGGGGYGDPFRRDPERVLGDWCEGFVTIEEARQTYGAVIDPATAASTTTRPRIFGGSGAGDGHYREVNEMPHCANCGVLVPAAPVVQERRGFQLVFCSTKCGEVYDRYTYPRYRERLTRWRRSEGPTWPTGT